MTKTPFRTWLKSLEDALDIINAAYNELQPDSPEARKLVRIYGYLGHQHNQVFISETDSGQLDFMHGRYNF